MTCKKSWMNKTKERIFQYLDNRPRFRAWIKRLGEWCDKYILTMETFLYICIFLVFLPGYSVERITQYAIC